MSQEANNYKIILTYFIKYNAHTSKVRTWISQLFMAKKLILFFKNYFTRINNCVFINHRSHLKTSHSYLPCIVQRKYFSIIFHVKKCALYSIKHGNWLNFQHKIRSLWFGIALVGCSKVVKMTQTVLVKGSLPHPIKTAQFCFESRIYCKSISCD
jgi:hypothetical protein